MFSESAEIYDLLYFSFKDYGAEADAIAALLRRAHPDARTILDVACGTGEHARLLSERHGYAVDGFDLDPRFVEIAAAKNPGREFGSADMMHFRLARRYDVVMCLFSSIAYVRTLENVRRTLERFAAHLAGGGLVVVEPWFPPGVLETGRVSLRTAEDRDRTVCRMSYTEVEGRTSRLRFEYLVGEREGIRHARETHELGLFTEDEMRSCFRAAGLVEEYDPQGISGRGIYLARPGPFKERTHDLDSRPRGR